MKVDSLVVSSEFNVNDSVESFQVDDVVALFITSSSLVDMLVWLINNEVLVSIKNELRDVNNEADESLVESSAEVETWAEVMYCCFSFVEALKNVALDVVVLTGIFVVLSWYGIGVVVSICEVCSESNVNSEVEKASFDAELAFESIEYFLVDDMFELFIISSLNNLFVVRCWIVISLDIELNDVNNGADELFAETSVVEVGEVGVEIKIWAEVMLWSAFVFFEPIEIVVELFIASLVLDVFISVNKFVVLSWYDETFDEVVSIFKVCSE